MSFHPQSCFLDHFHPFSVFWMFLKIKRLHFIWVHLYQICPAYLTSFSHKKRCNAILFDPNIWEHAMFMLYLMHVLQKSHLMSQVKNQLKKHMRNKSWDANTSLPTPSRWHWTQEHQVDANLNARPLHRSHERVLWLVANRGWQTCGLCRFVLYHQICELVQHGAEDVSKTPLQ